MENPQETEKLTHLSIEEAIALRGLGEVVYLDQLDRSYWWNGDFLRFGEEALGDEF